MSRPDVTASGRSLFPSPQPKKLSERVRKTKFPLTTWQTVLL
nr:MAG TPA: hypothetical protein [Caudoviricetes sp.]